MLVKQRSSNSLLVEKALGYFLCSVENPRQCEKQNYTLNSFIHSFIRCCIVKMELFYAVTHLHRQQNMILSSHIYLLIIHLFVVHKLMSLSWKIHSQPAFLIFGDTCSAYRTTKFFSFATPRKRPLRHVNFY